MRREQIIDNLHPWFSPSIAESQAITFDGTGMAASTVAPTGETL
jgi:hypothetical protein